MTVPPHRLPCVWIVTATAIVLAACDGSARERGRRLFSGELPLAGRVAGHGTSLPPQAAQCINCHAAHRATEGRAQTFGPALSKETLTVTRSRRGGPASRFDENSLCRLLRTGVDPASIVIAGSMPRYELSDTDCRALWVYLS